MEEEELPGLGQSWRRWAEQPGGLPGLLQEGQSYISESSTFFSPLRGPLAPFPWGLHLIANIRGSRRLINCTNVGRFPPGHERGQIPIHEYLRGEGVHAPFPPCTLDLAGWRLSSLPGYSNAHPSSATPFLVAGKSADFWYPG